MTPVEEAVRDFVSALHRETMGRGRVVSITLDAVTFDRLVELIAARHGQIVYGAPPYKLALAAPAGAVVTVIREGGGG